MYAAVARSYFAPYLKYDWVKIIKVILMNSKNEINSN